MNETQTSNQSSRKALKQITSVINYFTGVAVACAILMWSVFNFWLNFLTLKPIVGNWMSDPEKFPSDERTALLISLGFMLVTCVLPLAIGLWMLFRSLRKS